MRPVITIANRQRFLRPDRALLRRTLSEILRGAEWRGPLSLALVDDREIRRVHREFLGRDSATDVISFLYGDDPEGGPFGELVISAETALREARKRGIPPRTELLRYAVHGALHLLGHEDETPQGRRRMRALERRWLKKLEN